MTKIDIFSGFLGAGKTTLIKKLIDQAYKGEKLVLIENEFGEIGIDGAFLKDAGIEITEMNSGCICCSLVGDFAEALKSVISKFSPDRIIIEPSGVGKLSDVLSAVEKVCGNDVVINGVGTVVDAKKCKMYMKNFGEFFNNQIEHTKTIILSHTENMDQQKLDGVLELIKEHNADATIIATPLSLLDGKTILEAIESKNTLEQLMHELHDEAEICPECHHHHHEHEDCCGHEHHHEHHHDHEHCCEHEHHHHHHHADDVFTSVGFETAKKYSKDQILAILNALEDAEKYGTVLRAKGIVAGNDEWIHFDYVPGEPDVRTGSADIIGRLCVIGSGLNEDALKELFELS